jgi:hypothetical protein
MSGSRSSRVAARVVFGLVALAAGVRAEARELRVRYTFQPDCFRPSLAAACDARRTGTRLDLGPQIAVWIESADRTRFVDTLLVTNATALRGIGNRPGHWSLPSSPKFPYGKRLMALPVWAHSRGRLYDTVVMQDGPDKEFWLGFHESISSPDPYYCRPMSLGEIDVDAVSCPTAVFNSAKGKVSRTEEKIYYPPRNDLRNFTDRDCDDGTGLAATCPMSARAYGDANDLDAVAAATPMYGRPFTGSWAVPADLPAGDYALLLEIAKEFDGNATHVHPAYTDPSLTDSGLKNNIGQPSVLFRVPFKLGGASAAQAATMDIAGYGDWNGATGVLHPPDQSISDTPGSGRGRLLAIAQPALAGGAAVMGRLHVVTEVPGGPTLPDAGPVIQPGGDAGAPDGGQPTTGDGGLRPALDAPGAGCTVQTAARVAALVVPKDGIEAERAEVRFQEPEGPAFEAIERYEIRVWEGADQTADAFASGTPAETLTRETPGGMRSLRVVDLKGERHYTVGVRPAGHCLDGVMSFAPFDTVKRSFAMLSGCFIATAAYGSPQAAGVELLRKARDRARAATPLAAAAVALYERASPPLAELLRGTEVGRALVREALAPILVTEPAPARPAPLSPSRGDGPGRPAGSRGAR